MVTDRHEPDAVNADAASWLIRQAAQRNCRAQRIDEQR
ncbi:hypothetical protein I553_10698 [Mycobacterium xenopi 4042]|uniref:Uncharacterized protein n=1 Tax=Mycobacterium xenopi 4042 TaxID=1299334 RepID=X8DBG8_MYCXE|nr:hypothetical protein I553_10698 [Mycobacterium xenopi 4042]